MSYRRPMSALRVWPLVLGLLGGCLTTVTQPSGGGDDYPPYQGGGDDGGWGSGEGGSGGSSGFGCHADADCGGTFVCARDGECLTAANVHVIHVVWTLDQQPASQASCATIPAPLELSFTDQDGATFGFAPVPCVEGKFTIDKMPTSYTSTSLYPEYNYDAGGANGYFDATGTATLDLPY
jgi:hypothetical protein